MIAAAGQGSSSGSSNHVIEIVVAALLFLGGLRSLLRWFRTQFDAESARERFLYSLFASARVGTWLSLGAIFLGYAIVTEPQSLPWYTLVPLGLAGVQAVTGLALARSGGRRPTLARDGTPGVNAGIEGKAPAMDARREHAGPLEPEKHGESADPGHPQPDAAEVESARILANEARSELRAFGLTDLEIGRLADEFIALDRGEGLPEFVAWARDRTGRSGRRSTAR